MNSRTISFRPAHPDGVLRVVIIGRISTPHQDQQSIEASYEYVRTYLDRAYHGPTHIEMLGEQASGMLADRETIRRVEELIDAGQVDLIIAEDLGRIYRNPRLQYQFIQDAVDRDIRVICVADFLAQPILGGVRVFRKITCQRVYKTGKHRRRKNAKPLTKFYPELAHLTQDEDAKLKEAIARRRLAYRRKSGADHRRYRVPRCRAIWPGQAATCGICGAMMYQYGSGKLKCRNALKRDGIRCWNHVQVDCGLTRDRVIAWLFERIDQEPGAREAMVEAAWAEMQRVRRRHQRREGDQASTIAALEKQAANLAKAIAQGGQLEALVHELRAVERALDEARRRYAEAAGQDTDFGEYTCKEDVAARLEGTLHALACSSYPFGDLMRRVFPEFVVQPVQALDRGLVRPRGMLKFRPTGVLNGKRSDKGGVVDETVVIDLFNPPQKVTDAIRVRKLLERNPGMTRKAISQQMGIERMRTRRAHDYARLMIAEGRDDPFRELTEKPANVARWKPRRPR